MSIQLEMLARPPRTPALTRALGLGLALVVLAAMPAVRVGQVHPWCAAAPFSYRAHAPRLPRGRRLLGTVKKLARA